MHTARHNVETRISSDGKEEYSTVLKAKFRFKEEVAPKDRGKVREILNFYDMGMVSVYLRDQEGLSRDYPGKIKLTGYNMFSDHEKRLEIYQYPFQRLGFNLKVTSNKNIPFEEMFNLDGLNEFILTGEIKKIPSEKP
ncbi:hypothetical protein CMI39_02590 [Candidatus Pacearchaeota archaeon]|jgi:hypothetical protein|nr:hypothetical protein [Candidatus Pacearchaeota archaeon]|tara:strand:+ start:2411 stop:2824 length:414 start_codon:yes stop_codon:yes gene_type:complete